MMCRKPFTKGVQSYGCGQCMPCRFNRRRIWTHRIMLESLVHEKACFPTLTYKDEKLPEGGTLEPRHLQLFLKSLRKHRRVRYYAVGEYGDKHHRPHYHLALFGCDNSFADNQLLQSVWDHGRVYSGSLTFDSAQYVAGYINKKMTRKDDERLQGRYPEFARMSLRPGLGCVAIKDVAHALQNKHGWDEIVRTGDVPKVLRHARRDWPLGRYMRSKLREAMNFASVKEDDDAAYKRSAEMLVVYQNRILDANGGLVSSFTGKPVITVDASLKLAEEDEQKRLNMEGRSKLYMSRRN